MLVEGHERHHIPQRGARHGLVAGDPPLDDVSEWRKPARLDKTEQLLAGSLETLKRVQFDITAIRS
jgi:hypothetical protein